MLAELYVLSGRDAGKLIDAVGPTIFLGRAATNHYRIRDPQASRVHCRIDVTRTGLCLQDAGSGNGTFVNDAQVDGSIDLQDGDEIRVGNTRLKVLIETGLDREWAKASSRKDGLEGSGTSEVLSTSALGETSAVGEVSAVEATSPTAESSSTGGTAAAPSEAPGDVTPAGLLPVVPAAAPPRRKRGLREVLPGYRLARRLGGHSHLGIAVYRAEQRSLGRTVALKVFLPKGPTRREHVDRFLREAKAIARLPHPNIVTIHDVISRGKMRVIVMEYLAGGSLADRLEDGQPLDVEEVLDLGEGIAQALGFLHTQGVVHRNIKPSNVLLAQGLGTYKLGGFGFATGPAVLERQGDTCFVASSPLEGFAFLSPEQLGDDLGKLTAASDVYSLGATLHASAAGEPPFAAETTVELGAAIMRDEPPPLEQLPAPLRTIISRCLRKDPTERYPDAVALLHELRACRAALDDEA